MKKFTLLILVIAVSSFSSFAQKTTHQINKSTIGETTILTDFTEFSDDFEAGMSKWTVTNNWGLTTSKSHSPSNSLSESPTGNYTNSQTSYCTMTNGVDLSAKMSASVSFWAQYKIEAAFDYMYLDVSTDNFTTFTNLEVFDGEVTTWTQYTYSLGGFVGLGNNNIKLRFRFISDQGFVMDGMYIDDFVITSSDEDHSPPLVLSAAPEFYEGVLGEYVVGADIIDISGLATVQCTYNVDGVAQTPVPGVLATEDHYTFTIPAQSAGSNVDYIIEATDASTFANSVSTAEAYYIAGEYYKYDNAQVDFFVSFVASEGAAVAFSLNGPTHLATALIRNYIDIEHNNSDMLFHIWSAGPGGPGTDLITPFTVTPEASLSNTSPMTRIDLRPYMAQLSNLTGDIFVGFTVLNDTVNLTETNPGSTGRSFFFDGSAWGVASGADFHFRLITTGSGVGVPEAEGKSFTLAPNPMDHYTFVSISETLLQPRIELYNMEGRKLDIKQYIQGDKIQLVRGQLTSGLYLLKVMDGNKIVGQEKLMIK
ncbi:MAG: T9SS type A sorting domain-containing protein [Bacteroidales bacterium]|nr:T9SS type A sorting domain-containing protein [Bacteroidales bacterium]